jgi:hypothetical protein
MQLIQNGWMCGLLGLALALTSACGGKHQEPDRPKAKAKPASAPLPGVPPRPVPLHGFSCTLVNNGPVPGLQEVNLTILGLAFQDEASAWHPVQLPVTELKVNLLDPAPIQLAPEERLPAGLYGAFRFTFGPHPTVKGADGTVHALHLPPELAQGIPLRDPLRVGRAGRVDAWLILDLLTAIGPLPPAGGVPAFRPASALARQKALTGALTGTLVDQATGAALPGVTVTARPLGDHAEPQDRLAVTDAQGRFTLDLLPFGPNLVSTQPQVGGTTYEAAGLQITLRAPEQPAAANPAARQAPTTPEATPDHLTLACTPCPAPGSVQGSLRFPLEHGRKALVELLRAPEGGAASFAVRRTVLHPGQHDYVFTHMPQGRYVVRIALLPGHAAARETRPFLVDAGTHREDL